VLLTENLALNARTNFQNQPEIRVMFGRNPDLANLSEHSGQFLLNMALMLLSVFVGWKKGPISIRKKAQLIPCVKKVIEVRLGS